MIDARPFLAWIIDEYEPSVRVDRGAGHYTRQPGEAVVELYGVADMACVLHTIGRLQRSESERREWDAAFTQLQALDADRRAEHFDWYLGAHSLTAAVSILAEGQRFLGAHEIISDKPLRLVLDHRPFV